MPARPAITDYALLVLLAFIWGSSFTLIKVVVGEIPPLSLTVARIAVAALVLALVAAMRGEEWPRRASEWRWVVAAGMSGSVVPFSLISWGEEKIDSGLAAIYIAIVPIMVLVLTHYFTRDERFTWPRLIGVMMGFGGLVVLVGPDVAAGLDEHLLRQAAVAAAAVSYAVNALTIKKLAGKHAAATAAAIMVVSALMLAPFAAWLEWPIAPSGRAVGWAALLGVVHTGLATLIMFHLIGRAGAGFFSMINFLIPLVGYFLGVALLGEAVSGRALAALALILGGIYISTRMQARGARAGRNHGSPPSRQEVSRDGKSH